jgi:hypothetical protein
MAIKTRKLAARPVLSMRVPAAMRESLVREASKRRIKVSEEAERRLTYYDLAMQQWGEPTAWGERFRDTITDDAIDKIAERIATKLKQTKGGKNG